MNIKRLYLLILLPFFAVAARGYDYWANGIYYAIGSNTATVTGISSDYTIINIPWSVYYEKEYYPVTSIYPTAFYGKSQLTSVSIPSSVTSIGYNAFSYCKNLTSITLPSSISKIEEGTFEYCSNLTSITLPENLEEIGTSAFRGCTSLTSITLPSSTKSIGTSAFSGCTSLDSITLPSSIKSIGSEAFAGCRGLTKHEMNDITFALNEAIQYSEVYYLYNTDADLFLSKGNSYGTHAVLGEDALPVRIGTSGSHTYLYIDNADDTKTLLYRENGGDDSQIYVDGNGLGSGRQYFWIITADSNGTLVIKAEDHAGEALYLGNIPTRDDYDYQNETSLDTHVDIVSNATESDNIHWMLLPEKLIKRLDSGSALNGDLNGDGDVDILDATIIVYRQLGRE